jgi:hypothetical protein
MAPNISDVRRYAVCRVGEDGIYSCGHEHESIADAMQCLIPDGGEFIRACESGVLRSLNESELLAFLAALREMPWRSPGWG